VDKKRIGAKRELGIIARMPFEVQKREITRDKIRAILLNAKRLDDFLCWSTFRLGTRKLQKDSRLKGFAIEISKMR
jgi:hypothetical protein